MLKKFGFASETLPTGTGTPASVTSGTQYGVANVVPLENASNSTRNFTSSWGTIPLRGVFVTLDGSIRELGMRLADTVDPAPGLKAQGALWMALCPRRSAEAQAHSTGSSRFEPTLFRTPQCVGGGLRKSTVWMVYGASAEWGGVQLTR